jgi:hypothetical protein
LAVGKRRREEGMKITNYKSQSPCLKKRQGQSIPNYNDQNYKNKKEADYIDHYGVRYQEAKYAGCPHIKNFCGVQGRFL